MRKILIVLAGVLLLSADTGGGIAVPNSLNMPQGGEAARYPQDLIIGELGQGQASDAAYAYTRSVLSALLKSNASAPVLAGMDKPLAERTLAALKSIGPEKYRIGGGREDIGGGASFIFRFVGREQWIAGEVFVRFEEGGAAKAEEAPETTKAPGAEKNGDADAATGGAADAAGGNTAASDAGESAPAPAAAPSPVPARWVVDDIILDDAVRIGASAETYRYDFSPYERFF